MTKHYDAIVVGARCAGAPTAMLLARLGHRVLLIDKSSFPSDTLSTHLVQYRAMAYLQKWGLRSKLTELDIPFQQRFTCVRDGIALTGAPTADAISRCLERAHGWPSNGILKYDVEWACIRRTVLDDVLVKAAIAAGVELRESFIFDELLMDEGKTIGIRGRSAFQSTVERAQVVVGADGRHSQVAQSVDSFVMKKRHKCSFTFYSYYSGVPLEGLSFPVHLRGRLGVGVAPTNDGLLLVSVWGPKDWFAKFRTHLQNNFLSIIAYCYPELEQRLRNYGQRVGNIRGTVELANVLKRGFGPGWLLVGDAGCQVDQVTAIGITHAFRDAQLAADSIHEALIGSGATGGNLALYDSRRLLELIPYFDHVANLSECRTAKPEELQFLKALQHRPDDASRFIAYNAALIGKSEFFSPEEIQKIVGDYFSSSPSNFDSANFHGIAI